jgi:hypothetical protein
MFDFHLWLCCRLLVKASRWADPAPKEYKKCLLQDSEIWKTGGHGLLFVCDVTQREEGCLYIDVFTVVMWEDTNVSEEYTTSFFRDVHNLKNILQSHRCAT